MNQNTNIYNIIGKNIKKYRKQKGITQRQLADMNFLSDSFIAKLESVTYQTISIDTLEKIANSLDIEIGKFFEKENISKWDIFYFLLSNFFLSCVFKILFLILKFKGVTSTNSSLLI